MSEKLLNVVNKQVADWTVLYVNYITITGM